jgi:hypothetical protein
MEELKFSVPNCSECGKISCYHCVHCGGNFCSEDKSTHINEIECTNCYTLICEEMSYMTDGNDVETLCYRCYVKLNVKNFKEVMNKKLKLHRRDDNV